MIPGESLSRPAASSQETHTLFGQTMGLVAVTAGLFALGAYLGRDMSFGWGWVWFIASFLCLLGLNVAVRQSEQLAIGVLFGFGILIREREPRGALASGLRDCSVHRRVRCSRVRHPARSLRPRASLLLGVDRLDRLRHPAHLRPDPERLAHLRDPRARDLLRLCHDRLPTASEFEEHRDRAATGSVDLPRHPQRLPVLPVALRQKPGALISPWANRRGTQSGGGRWQRPSRPGG